MTKGFYGIKMNRIKNVIIMLCLVLGICSINSFAEETELEVSLGKSATIVNLSTQTQTDASVFFTNAGYTTSNNQPALDAGLAINWGGRGYIDIDLECDAVISRVVWTKNHVFGAMGMLNAYGSNDEDFENKVLLGEVTDGEGVFSDENYYRYIRLEKAANYDFYPGRISVYGYKRPFVFNGINNSSFNPDSVLELEFSEILSSETETDNIKITKSGVEINAEAEVLENKILISSTDGFLPGGIYEINIPQSTVKAEDTRIFSEEIKKYFAVSTDKTDVLSCSFENDILNIGIRNKTEDILNITLWTADYENSVSGAVTEQIYTVLAGETAELKTEVEEKFAVCIFEDAAKLKKLFSCFSNVWDTADRGEVQSQTVVRYVDGSVLVSGSAAVDEITAVLTAENAALSATEVKASSTANVKDGSFFIDLKLGDNMQSGNYTVWLSDADTPSKLGVYVLGETDKQKYAEKIADMTGTELKEFFETEGNGKILSGIGVLPDRPQNLTALYTAIENAELSGTYSEIADGINTQIALAVTKEKGYVYGVENFNSYIKLDTTETLYSYINDNKLADKAQTFMKNEFNDITAFKTELYNSFKLAVFTNAPSVEYASEFAQTNNDFFGLNFDGDYSSLSDINKKNVISKAMQGTSPEDIQTKFNKAVSEYKKKEETPKKPSGGGGGGGGGVSAPKINVVLPEVKVDQLKETTQNPTLTSAFSDMTQSHWAYNSVSELAKKGIVSGFENKFNPDNNVKREEFVKMLTEAAKIENTNGSSFNDVPSDAWYYPYVSRALNSGIISGISDTLFGTGQNITRQDMAVMIYNTLVFCSAVNNETDTAEVFSDAESISGYAREAVNKLSGMKLINGRENNSFAPLENATRAEAAELIYRLLGYIG